ncbi:MAG: hypothetical protein ACR2JE_15255 [Acidobacteriaceae bacterium]
MPSDTPGRTSLRLDLVVFAVLAMAVFGWGLHYKLSLYHSAESNSVHGPVAKLLSQKEQAHPVKPAADQAADMAQPSLPALPWLALLAWVLGSPIWMSPGYTRSLFRPSVLLHRLQHWRTARSLRPPPFFLLAR